MPIVLHLQWIIDNNRVIVICFRYLRNHCHSRHPRWSRSRLRAWRDRWIPSCWSSSSLNFSRNNLQVLWKTFQKSNQTKCWWLNSSKGHINSRSKFDIHTKYESYSYFEVIWKFFLRRSLRNFHFDFHDLFSFFFVVFEKCQVNR